MMHHVELEQAEWDLVLELLENEDRALHTEIHHTDRTEMHEALLQRQKMLQGVIGRVRQQLPVPAA